MYEKCKTYLETIKSYITVKRLIIGALCVLMLYSVGSLASGYFTARANYQRAIERLEQTQGALEDSRRLNRELNKLIEASRQLNNERAKALTELRTINEKQGQELAKASNKITEQEQRLNQASSSLNELKAEIKNNKRTEQRLRRQRDTWAISNAALFLAGALRR